MQRRGRQGCTGGRAPRVLAAAATTVVARAPGLPDYRPEPVGVPPAAPPAPAGVKPAASWCRCLAGAQAGVLRREDDGHAVRSGRPLLSLEGRCRRPDHAMCLQRRDRRRWGPSPPRGRGLDEECPAATTRVGKLVSPIEADCAPGVRAGGARPGRATGRGAPRAGRHSPLPRPHSFPHEQRNGPIAGRALTAVRGPRSSSRCTTGQLAPPGPRGCEECSRTQRKRDSKAPAEICSSQHAQQCCRHRPPVVRHHPTLARCSPWPAASCNVSNGLQGQVRAAWWSVHQLQSRERGAGEERHRRAAPARVECARRGILACNQRGQRGL